jgi:hypothetical protein
VITTARRSAATFCETRLIPLGLWLSSPADYTLCSELIRCTVERVPSKLLGDLAHARASLLRRRMQAPILRGSSKGGMAVRESVRRREGEKPVTEG